MTDDSNDNLLERLARRGRGTETNDPWANVATTQPDYEVDDKAAVETVSPADEGATHGEEADQRAGRTTNQLGHLPTAVPHAGQQESESGASSDTNSFVPLEPSSFKETGLTDTEIEALILKFLLNRGSATGREIADQVKLPFKLIDELLREMKADQTLVYRGSASMNDYQYLITELGRERGRRVYQQCTFFGAAPVSLGDYVASVEAQSLTRQHPSVDDLRRAFSDLLLSQRMLNRLGPAINSGRGLFLYGAPGNGKTSIAERVTEAFGQHIWIPRSLGIDGEIIRLYDPSHHVQVPLEKGNSLLHMNEIDRRWIRIRRPTIVVGGELTMANLEVTCSPTTHISESPVQMKSNCGTLVIDDFGRQRIQIDELLNRWIVPLEKRFDLLNLANGKKIEVPFDQLIIFATNLEPRDLVDEAFLRRIPYKIEVSDPTEDEFRELFRMMSVKLGFVYNEKPVNYLIEKHYNDVERSFRCCHPRDLLLQVHNFCAFQKVESEMTNANFDYAVENYFAVM